MKRDFLDELLRRKLDGYQEVPPADAWPRIEAGLSAPRPRRTIRRVGYAAAASLLAAALATGIYLGNRQEKFLAVSHSSTEPVAFAKITPEPVVPAAAETRQARPFRAASAPSVTADTPRITADAVEPLPVRADPPGVEPAAPELPAAQAEKPRGQAGEVRKAAQPEWYRTTERDEPPKNHRKGRRGISASLYAANMSSGSHRAAVPQNTYYMMSSDMSSPSRMRESAGVFSARSVRGDLVWDHRTPVTFGAAVSFGITPRISLETGLSFTRLRSTSEIQVLTVYEIEQKLDYVGLPISATYTFLDSRFLTLYGRAGGTLEYCVSARQTTRAKTGAVDDPETVEKIEVKGLQTSVGAGIGGMVNITPHIGIYVEPGVGLYLEKENQPDSYRTAHPLTFDLRAGLRFRFR